MQDLVDIHYPKAERIRVVLDNLSTHRPKNLYEAFPPEEARRILRRLEFHYTPTHASWLNMVEIEISVLASQCLNRRIPDRATLEREVAAWQHRRNVEGARIKWMFDAASARRKLGKLYPAPAISACGARRLIRSIPLCRGTRWKGCYSRNDGTRRPTAESRRPFAGTTALRRRMGAPPSPDGLQATS